MSINSKYPLPYGFMWADDEECKMVPDPLVISKMDTDEYNQFYAKYHHAFDIDSVKILKQAGSKPLLYNHDPNDKLTDVDTLRLTGETVEEVRVRLIQGMKTGQGEKIVTEQGATRESRSGRGRFDLIPYESMEALAIWSEQGAIKYGDRNWEKGLSVKDCISRMIGHALKAGSGWTDEDHLAAVMWNASAAITMMKRRPDCNDHVWIAPEVNQEEAVATFPRPKWTGRTCGCGNKEFTIEWHLGSTDFDVCTKCGTKHPKNGEEGIDPMEVSCKNCGSGNVVIGRNNRGMVTYVSCDECKWLDKYE